MEYYYVVRFFIFRHLISASLMIEKENFFIILIFSFIFTILGRDLNLFIAFVVLSISASGENHIVEYPAMSKFSTALVKKLFILSATSLLSDMIFSSSISMIFLEFICFSEIWGFTVFQNFLLSVICLGPRLS